MKKFLAVFLGLLIIGGVAKAVSTTKTSDNMTRSERQTLNGVLKKLQICQNAELSGANFAFKVTRKGSTCVYYERNKDGAMTCSFPLDVAKKYGANGIIMNNAILDGSINEFNPFDDSSISRAFAENISLATKYCKK